MHRASSWLCGFGTGATAIYLLDPVTGRRRRALATDRLKSIACEFTNFLDVAARDLVHRARGLLAAGWAHVSGKEVTDAVLVHRVRSALGRIVSHPHAVKVGARDGQILLGGPVLAHEVNDLLTCVSTVSGVRGVDNRLEVHKEPGNLSALQGGTGRRPQGKIDVLQANWSPATRLLAGAAGTWLMARCLRRRTLGAALLGTVGFGLTARSVANRDLVRLAGLGGGRRGFDIQKTITINAPVDRVFAFWSRFENFPQFMANLIQVRDLGGGRSHWTARGPAGSQVSWLATTTCSIPNECLAWRSEPGSTVPNAGWVRFERQGDAATRVNVHLTYNPPAGVLGHAAALFFCKDPKSEMDEDLARLKTLLEQGKTSAPGKGTVRTEAEQATTIDLATAAI